MDNNSYKILCEYQHLDDVNNRIKPIQEYMENKTKVCKFCGRKQSDKVHFGKKAHVISANVGNRVLKTLDECDECNENTGLIFESDFAKYIQPFKVVSGVYGRGNSIKYVDTPKHHTIERNKDGYIDEELKVKTIIVDTNDENRMVQPTSDNEGNIKLRRQEYDSYSVYLSLLKMAISMMPKAEMNNFKDSLLRMQSIYAVGAKIRKDKIKNDELEKTLELIKKSFPNVGILEFLPGINPFEGTGAKIFKRINDNQKNSLYLFQLSFGNYAIYIPVATDYELNNQEGMHLTITPTNENSELRKINFNNMEEEYICDYIALGKVEVLKEYFPQLEKHLKEKGMLDNK